MSSPWPRYSSEEWNKLLDTLILNGNIDSPNEMGERPLCCVAAYGHIDCVRKLLATGAVDINAQDTFGRTPIYRASARGKVDVVKLLLQHGANPNISRSNGFSPIYQAVKNGHIDVVRVLLDSGTELQSKESSLGPASVWCVARGDIKDFLEERAV